MRSFRPTGNAVTDISTLLAWRGDGLTFVEILRWLPYLKGEQTIHHESNSSLVLWKGVSRDCVTALETMHAEGEVVFKPTISLTYILDGHRSRLPIAAKKRSYKEPHWLPVTLSLPAKARARQLAEQARQAEKAVVA